MNLSLVKRMLAMCVFLNSGFLCAQEKAGQERPPERYEMRKDHDPDGTGKFYMGREIAQVMSHFGANWLDRKEREKEEAPSKLLPALKIKPGSSVADVGCGSGYYSLKLSEAVGPKGKVYANDIQPEMLAIVREKMKAKNITNIEPIQCTVTDPKLPAGKVDMILLVDVYHEFSHPYEVMVELVKSLAPGGRVVFVEFRLEDPKVPIKLVHKMSKQQVLKEMEPHALKHVETLDTLPWQHVIIFEKVADNKKAENDKK
jgi:ubiquinone/menaquinone biosynthesis C-methylase UbiE